MFVLYGKGKIVPVSNLKKNYERLVVNGPEEGNIYKYLLDQRDFRHYKTVPPRLTN